MRLSSCRLFRLRVMMRFPVSQPICRVCQAFGNPNLPGRYCQSRRVADRTRCRSRYLHPGIDKCRRSTFAQVLTAVFSARPWPGLPVPSKAEIVSLRRCSRCSCLPWISIQTTKVGSPGTVTHLRHGFAFWFAGGACVEPQLHDVLC
jgi:hypothetical protein